MQGYENLCIFSLIVWELEPFWNYKGFSIIFPKILEAVQRIDGNENFLIPVSIIFSNPKVLGFLFSTKNSLT